MFCVAAGKFNRKRTVLSSDRGIMAGEMLRKPTPGRLLTALRIALYPAFESAEARGFQALIMGAENARGSGDLARAEVLYSTATAEAWSSSDPSYLSRAHDGLARVYQEQRRYREAERIFRGQLEEAVNSPKPNTLVHAGHMSLALLYQDEGKFAEAETHYKAALAETEKTELFPGRGFWCSTSMWLARFYVARNSWTVSHANILPLTHIYSNIKYGYFIKHYPVFIYLRLLVSRNGRQSPHLTPVKHGGRYIYLPPYKFEIEEESQRT